MEICSGFNDDDNITSVCFFGKGINYIFVNSILPIMHVFYTQLPENNIFTLDKNESHHCIHVLRLKRGEIVNLIDGLGGFYEGELTELGKAEAGGRIISKKEVYEKIYKLTMAISPTKSIDRFEWFVEKAVEIGVDIIVPLMCKRTERKHIRLERLEKIAISAMKQSLNPWLTSIQEAIQFKDFMRIMHNNHSGKFIAHCDPDEKKDLLVAGGNTKEFIVLIGPEGDFTPEEIDLSRQNSFIPVSLGMNRLRTETAGVVACQIIASRMSEVKKLL